MQNYEAPSTPNVNYSAAYDRRDSGGDDASTLSSVTRLGDFARDEILALADLAGEIRSRGITGVMKVAASEAKEIVSSQVRRVMHLDIRNMIHINIRNMDNHRNIIFLFCFVRLVRNCPLISERIEKRKNQRVGVDGIVVGGELCNAMYHTL